MKNRTKQTIVSTEFLIDFLPRPCTPIACPLPTDKFHTRCDPDFVPTVGSQFLFSTFHDLSFYALLDRTNLPSIPASTNADSSLAFSRIDSKRYSQSVQPCPSFLSLSLSLDIRRSSISNFLPKRFFLFFQFPKQVIREFIYFEEGGSFKFTHR